jgi:hypothetical protein
MYEQNNSIYDRYPSIKKINGYSNIHTPNPCGEIILHEPSYGNYLESPFEANPNRKLLLIKR